MTDMDDAAGPDGDPIDAQFEPAPPSADHVVTPEKTPSRPGWKSLIGTGILATILGAGIGAGLDRSSNGSSGSDRASLDVSHYEAQIVALETEQKKLGSRLAALGADLEQAETRLAEEISEAAQSTPAPEPDTDMTDALASLSARVDLLSALPEGEGEDTGALSARLLAFEQSLANLQAGQGTRAEALAALTARLATLEATQSEAGTDSAELVSLYEDVAALKAQLAEAVSDTSGLDELSAKITRLEARDATAQSVLAGTRSSGQAALALLSLEAASDRGVPFPEIIPALENAGSDAGLLVELRAIAPFGAPTRDKLQNMLYGGLLGARALSDQGREADSAEADDGWGWVRRTFGDSVKITRSDAPAETSDNQALEDIANEAGSLLANGNIQAAITRINSLPEAERNAFTDWREAADRRIRLDEALIALRASMLEQER